MSEAADDGPGRREPAYRLFATEYDDADLQYAESDEERAPNYVVTPTGARVNRLFVVGVLTEVEPVSEEVLRGRVVDPTGAFVCYAGQYQPDERAVLDRIDPPEFVAVTGKARTFQPDDGDRVFTSVRPEAISTVDADTRDRWTVTAAERTIDRVEAMATAIALGVTGDRLHEALLDRGLDEGLAAGIPIALDHYGTTPTYLAAVRDLAIDAARHVAGELEELQALGIDPDADGDVTAADLLPEPVTPLAAEPGDSEGEPEPADAVVGGSEPEAGSAPSTASTETSIDAQESLNDPPEAELGSSETAESTESDTTEYDLEPDEREAVEAEYGTEFQSAAEVDEPGEADIETPTPEGAVPDETEPTEPVSETPDTATSSDESAATPEDAGSEDESTDLVDTAVAVMEDLDKGDGADRSAVIEAVAERTGADSAAIEDAIQEALMEGRCYEPDEDKFKPI